MAEGKNNAGDRPALFLTERSVEKVIHSIFLKLGLELGGVGAQAREGGDPLPGRSASERVSRPELAKRWPPKSDLWRYAAAPHVRASRGRSSSR